MCDSAHLGAELLLSSFVGRGPLVKEMAFVYKWFKKKGKQSHYRPEVPKGFQEVKVPRLRANSPGLAVRSAFLPPGNTPVTNFC